MSDTADQPLTVPVPRGYRVSLWEVREPIASGAFGTVYAARRRDAAGDTDPAGPDGVKLPRTVALKFLPTGTHTPRQLGHLRELVRRELELLSRLRLPRLIRMYQTLVVDDPERPELDGATVLVLERAEGSLDMLLDRDPRPASGPDLLTQVCAGLDQLHRAGWVHGDLKPANVLLMLDGTVRLADFNLSAELEGTHAYAPGFATPDYTPPELLWSEIGVRGQQIRTTADVWAFGVIAHVVLTDCLPFPGGTAEARRDAVVRYARGEEELRLSPALPEEWRQIVTDCLAPTHAERAPLSMPTLLRRVERAAAQSGSGRPHGWRPWAAWPRLPRSRAWRRYSLVAACALVLAGVGITTFVARGDDAPRYGYHHCPEDSVCFFSESNGLGQMCFWRGDDADWLSGAETCAWTRDRPVRSVFNRTDGKDVVYYRGRDFTPAGADLTREAQRTGCTTSRSQGNLSGTYAPASHRLVTKC